MKKLIVLALISTFSMSGFTNEAELKAVESNENARLCKMFTEKAENYQSTMRNDELAAATLESYKKRMSTFCSTSSIKS
jgi:pyruvate formate-lyase activating enzyme-like uncharacterized protein